MTALSGIRDNGCGQRYSGSFSTAAASASTSSSSRPAAMSLVTSGVPLVSVPVLSLTTVSMRADVSRAVAFVKRTPRLAARPAPTMIAVGVASPERVGARDDHDGDREEERRLDVGADSTHVRNVAGPPMSATSTSQNAACPGTPRSKRTHAE
nr:hypothetical protein [Intrasporangium calvum]